MPEKHFVFRAFLGVLGNKEVWALTFLRRPNPLSECYTSWKGTYSSSVSRYLNIHRGGTCVLMGNGEIPSQEDANILNSHTLIGTNKAILQNDYLKLSYYIAVSPHKINQYAHAIKHLDAVCFLSHLHWDRKQLPDSPKCIPIYTVDNIGEAVSEVSFEGNLLRPIRIGNTVSFVALQVAYFLGFSKVVLVGFSHRFPTSLRPNTFVSPTGPEEAPFYSPDPKSYEVSLLAARDFFHAAGRTIINATPESALEVFPKAPLANVLSGCKNLT